MGRTVSQEKLGAQGILGIITPAEQVGKGGDKLSTAVILGAQGILGSITTPAEHGGIGGDQLSTAIT